MHKGLDPLLMLYQSLYIQYRHLTAYAQRAGPLADVVPEPIGVSGLTRV